MTAEQILKQVSQTRPDHRWDSPSSITVKWCRAVDHGLSSDAQGSKSNVPSRSRIHLGVIHSSVNPLWALCGRDGRLIIRFSALRCVSVEMVMQPLELKVFLVAQRWAVPSEPLTRHRYFHHSCSSDTFGRFQFVFCFDPGFLACSYEQSSIPMPDILFRRGLRYLDKRYTFRAPGKTAGNNEPSNLEIGRECSWAHREHKPSFEAPTSVAEGIDPTEYSKGRRRKLSRQARHKMQIATDPTACVEALNATRGKVLWPSVLSRPKISSPLHGEAPKSGLNRFPPLGIAGASSDQCFRREVMACSLPRPPNLQLSGSDDRGRER
jgi:hypothetical protein